jgi:curved DNA-binding protein CbpA
MEGQLSEHPLAELISEIMEKSLSGALRVEHERARAVIYFDGGELIYAASNLHELRLPEYLKKRGLAIGALEADHSRSDFALANALTAKGALTQAALGEILTEQVTDQVRVLLLWISGHWSFDNRARLTEPIRVTLPLNQLLLDAARRFDLRFVSLRFGHEAELITPVTDIDQNLNLSSTEGFLLSRVEGPIAVAELVAISGLREPDAYRAIYGLVMAGVLVRGQRPYAFRANEGQRTKAPTRAVARKPVAPANVAPPPVIEPPRDAEQELEEFLNLLSQATNHYEVLNIDISADAEEVKRAYYSLARRYHPDRFHELARTPLHARLESAFARITQAHEMLSDPDQRANYDLKVAAIKRVSNMSRPKPVVAKKSHDSHNGPTADRADDEKLAEQRFQEGAAALQLGQTNAAIASLSAAARMAPKEPRYRAYYGRALAAQPQTQRLAEAELQAAVKLDPTNASYRLILAGLYRNLGFARRAIGELERALAIDPQNAEARKMLQVLENNKR